MSATREERIVSPDDQAGREEVRGSKPRSPKDEAKNSKEDDYESNPYEQTGGHPLAL